MPTVGEIVGFFSRVEYRAAVAVAPAAADRPAMIANVVLDMMGGGNCADGAQIGVWQTKRFKGL
jgi:hypothetical protein